jgi:tricorn protease
MRKFLATFGLALVITSAVHGDPDRTDTRLIRQPAVSRDHIAFVYADDLWICDLDGKNVRRLTSDPGVESNPVFSPDGATIAFSGQYDGNPDVFTIPTAGGPPTRLTWHPAPDVVRAFTPDGKAVLFSSPRHSFNNRYSQLFTVPLTGGHPEQLPIPNGVEASYSDDGKLLAYTPLSDPSQQWKHYRGGLHSRIWIYRLDDHSVAEVPQPKGGCNDTDPRWLDGILYFRSDRNGEFQLFNFDPRSKEMRQRTQFKEFPVLSLATGGGNLVFEQAGYLYRFFPAEDRIDRLKIGVASDLVETRARFIKGSKYIRNASISPSGARAAFEARGEIVTVPAEKGDARVLTGTPGIHEREPAWSPDGQSIAYFSDEGGEYKLHVRPASGKGAAKIYSLEGGSGFYERMTWSPDSKKIAYVDNSQTLFVIDLDTGKCARVAQEAIYGPIRTLRASWSPDSKWITYALGNRSAYKTVYVYSLADGKSQAVTDGLSDAAEPVFDAGGKYLYFLASTDAGPVNQWFAQSNSDMRSQYSLYLAVLRPGEPSPLARESDEEKGSPPPAADKKPAAPDKDPGAGAKKAEPKDAVRIDFDRLDQRIVHIADVPPGNYRQLRAGQPGQVFFLASAATPARGQAPAAAQVQRFDLSKRKMDTVFAGAASYWLTPDGKKALLFVPPETWAIQDVPPAPGGSAATPPTVAASKGKLNLDGLEIRVDPKAEWPEILDEAWRINRDYFYATNYHGVDWPAMRRKYEVFLPHLTSSGDLYRVIRWMLSELAVGHSYSFPPERLTETKPVPGGLLGADYEIANGRYRFKKVYGGLNWSPEAKAPLTAPGVDVKPGEYLLAVRGIELLPPTELYSLFENTAGKSIEITVGPNADSKESRTVTVEPLADEAALRNRDWVEGNLRKVHKATNGRVAYVYVPNTAQPGHAYFKRYFYPQADKDAIIIDERFNGGGQVADYYIDHLRRPFVSYWATRHGEDLKTPGAAIQGPKVMLIDETAGSGGDMLPWMFRKEKLGPLVGKRTWGGLVGILGFPTLMDGGRVTAPDLAIWTPESGWVVENEGVPPDYEVEQLPKDVIAGRDPQLEKAIELALAELAKNPTPKPTRPPFPVKVKP